MLAKWRFGTTTFHFSIHVFKHRDYMLSIALGKHRRIIFSFEINRLAALSKRGDYWAGNKITFDSKSHGFEREKSIWRVNK